MRVFVLGSGINVLFDVFEGCLMELCVNGWNEIFNVRIK